MALKGSLRLYEVHYTFSNSGEERVSYVRAHSHSEARQSVLLVNRFLKGGKGSGVIRARIISCRLAPTSRPLW